MSLRTPETYRMPESKKSRLEGLRGREVVENGK